MVIGLFQFFTQGSIPFTKIGVRKTVPSKQERMVALGLLYISFKSYSLTLAAFGVIVAHFTPTLYFFIASAAAKVTSSFVSSLYFNPKS